jgi:hypothetical protein
MTNFLSLKKLALIAGAAVVLAGCSLTGNGSVNTTGGSGTTPTETPAMSPTTGGAAPSGSSMGSGSYQLQGTTQGGVPQGQVKGSTDDQSLNQDLNNINANTDLNATVK